MRYNRLIAVSAFALTAAGAPFSAEAANIVETLKNSGQYSDLVDAMDKAGLTETLQGDGPYTVFAPNDQAFQRLQQGSRGQQQAHGSQQQSSQGQQQQTGQQQSAQSQQEGGQSQQAAQSEQGGDSQVLQQVSSEQLKQVLTHHIVEGKELSAQDVLGKEQKVQTMSGDQLTIDGTGTMVVLVPAGLSVSRVGDEVFVRREVAAVAQPAVTVSTTGQQGQQQSGQQGQQQAAAQSGQQSGQESQQQQATAESGHQGQQQSGQQGQQGQQQAAQAGSQGQDQPMAEQQGLLRAAMVVEPGIQADNGVIHGIDQVLVPQKIEQQLMSGQGQSSGQQDQG